jgi:hypothetical protein
MAGKAWSHCVRKTNYANFEKGVEATIGRWTLEKSFVIVHKEQYRKHFQVTHLWKSKKLAEVNVLASHKIAVTCGNYSNFDFKEIVGSCSCFAVRITSPFL